MVRKKRSKKKKKKKRDKEIFENRKRVICILKYNGKKRNIDPEDRLKFSG